MSRSRRGGIAAGQRGPAAVRLPASHDLQEPIRNVAVYSEIVAKRYRHLLDADGLQFLGFLLRAGAGWPL